MTGAVKLYQAQSDNPAAENLPYDIRLNAVLEAEYSQRLFNRQQRLIKESRIPWKHARLDNVNWGPERKLDRGLIEQLADCTWLKSELRPWVSITGATGVGKSFFSQMLGNEACYRGFRTLYYPMQDLLLEIIDRLEHKDLKNFLKRLNKIPLLIIDDFGSPVLSPQVVDVLLALIEARIGMNPLIVVSQIPQTEWHAYLGANLKAEAIIDRLINQSITVSIEGNSKREEYGAGAVFKKQQEEKNAKEGEQS